MLFGTTKWEDRNPIKELSSTACSAVYSVGWLADCWNGRKLDCRASRLAEVIIVILSMCIVGLHFQLPLLFTSKSISGCCGQVAVLRS